MKSKILYFIFAIMAMTTLYSCGEDKTPIDNSWNTGTLNVTEEVLLDGSTTQSLNIKASVKPTLTCDAEWLKIGEVKKLTIGIYNTELKAEVNTTGETRTAKITVTAGQETATVTVMQVSSDVVEILSIDPQGDLNPEGGTLTIKYVATGTPATNLPEWIKETTTRNLVEGTLNLSYAPNNTGTLREGIIVLAVGKDAVANITVRQPAKSNN